VARRVVPTPFPTPFVTTPTQFGQAVRAARTASGMTLADAALALGVAKQTLQSLERGTASVGLATALRIAHALGVAVLAVPGSQRSAIARRLSPEPGVPRDDDPAGPAA